MVRLIFGGIFEREKARVERGKHSRHFKKFINVLVEEGFDSWSLGTLQ